jgi:hypothetical protein
MNLFYAYWPDEIRAIVGRASAYRHEVLRATGQPPRAFVVTDDEYHMLRSWYVHAGLMHPSHSALQVYGMTCVRAASPRIGRPTGRHPLESIDMPLDEWERAVNAMIQSAGIPQYDADSIPLDEWERAVNAMIHEVKTRRGLT